MFYIDIRKTFIYNNDKYSSKRSENNLPSIKQSVETSVINDKGELVSKRANKTLSWGAEPSYIKLYLQDILYLSDIPNKHTQVLYELLKRSTYAGDKDGMQVIVNSYVKNCIKDKLGLKNVGSISNAITELVKGKILYRVGTGAYNFNPYLFGKGDWQDVSRLRLEVNYDDIKGKTFKTVCEYNDKKESGESETDQPLPERRVNHMILNMDKIQFESRAEIGTIIKALEDWQEDHGKKDETVQELINKLDAMSMNW